MTVIFARVLKRKYAEELVKYGRISLGRIQGYHSGDDVSLRTDPLEGASQVITPANCDKLRISIHDPENREKLAEVTPSSLQFREFGCLPEHGYLLSMARFPFSDLRELPSEPGTWFFEIPDDFRRFGDTLVTIPWDLVRPKLDAEIKKMGFQSGYRVVNYRRPNDGVDSWDIFTKPSEYEWQREYRYVVKACKLKPKPDRLVIDLGSLEGHAEILPLEEGQRLVFLAKPRELTES